MVQELEAFCQRLHPIAVDYIGVCAVITLGEDPHDNHAADEGQDLA